jgi:hypothetical protein
MPVRRAESEEEHSKRGVREIVVLTSGDAQIRRE